MANEYGRQAQAQLLSSQLIHSGYSSEEAIGLVDWFIQEFGHYEAASPPPGTLGLLVKKFAIRKDDLNIFDCATKALIQASSALAGGHLLSISDSLSAKIGVLVAIFNLIRDTHNKGVSLNDDQVRILTILRSNVPDHSSPGLTAEELLTILRRTDPTKEKIWIEHLLQQLSKIPTRGGSNRELVSQHLGLWRPHI